MNENKFVLHQDCEYPCIHLEVYINNELISDSEIDIISQLKYIDNQLLEDYNNLLNISFNFEIRFGNNGVGKLFILNHPYSSFSSFNKHLNSLSTSPIKTLYIEFVSLYVFAGLLINISSITFDAVMNVPVKSSSVSILHLPSTIYSSSLNPM